MSSSAIGATGAIAALPSGVMIDYAATVAPAGWLMCDGSAVSRTVFASLFATISTTYGVGDGSTTFNLPDFRGRFARYMDNMGTPAGAASRDTGRVLGVAQADAMQGHYHSKTETNHSHSVGSLQTAGLTAGASSYSLPGGSTTTGGSNSTVAITSPATDGTNGTPRTAAETRPINLACNRIIKT